MLDKVPVGATIEVSTDNTTYSFKKEEEDLYAISATPAKHWIRNGVTKVFIIGALPGGGAVVENGIIRTGAGVEYRFSEGGKMLASTISPVRFVKISYKKSEDEKK